MKRRRLREMALRILFQYDLGKVPVKEALARELESMKLRPEDEGFLVRLVLGTREHLREIDGRISAFARGWDITRMGAIDRNILRLATYEIFHFEDIPVSVSINEAVELAKIYGDEESPGFINGILASIAREKEGAPMQRG